MTPSRRTSAFPAVSVAITARPIAIASITVVTPLSESVGRIGTTTNRERA